MKKNLILLYITTLLICSCLKPYTEVKGIVINKIIDENSFWWKGLKSTGKSFILIIADREGKKGYIYVDQGIFNGYELGDIYLGEGIEE